MARYLLLNGPNLNALGMRRPDVYGSTSLAQLVDMARTWAADLGAELEHLQSNHEGDLIDRIHAARDVTDGIVFNPGAFTHTSFALHDALESIEVPTVEVHISNVEEREPWRRVSVVRPACVYTIYGRGIDGYLWALRHLHHRAAWPAVTDRYGEHPDHLVDLRIPETVERPPLAVLVHGGFWRHMWTRDLMDGLAVDLARRGVATANIEYRRVGTGGGWPGSADDVTAAVHWLLERDEIEPDRVVVIGHSAGGHLAAVAVDRLALAGHTLRLVTLGGVLDMEAALADDLGGGAAHAFLAGADPTEASPLWMFDSEFDAVVVHGSDDDRVPAEQSRRFCGKHRHARLLELPGVGHFEFLDPAGPVWHGIADEIVRLLE
jgi:3-dehydroquinate dehydratase-2